MRSTQSLRLSSKKLGLTALHAAAFYGQTGMLGEILTHGIAWIIIVNEYKMILYRYRSRAVISHTSHCEI